MSPMKKVMIFASMIMAPILIAVAVWLIHALVMGWAAKKFGGDVEKISETKPPLSTAQVEQLMGPPLRIEQSESADQADTGAVYHYATNPPGGDFQVIFVNGVVFHTALPTYAPKS